MKEAFRSEDNKLHFPHLLLISASAGSGKTEALARRYLRFVLSSDVPHRDISNILAITFTRLAVREMKERILVLLKKLALRQDPELAGYLAGELRIEAGSVAELAQGFIERLLLRYSEFQVTTIDSFNNRLLNAAAAELDLAPQCQVATDYSRLLDLALDSMLRAMAEDREVATTVREYVAFLNQQPRERYAWSPSRELGQELAKLLAAESKLVRGLIFDNTARELDRAFEKMGDCLKRIREIAGRANIDLIDLSKLEASISKKNFEGLKRKFDNSPCYARDRGHPAVAEITAIWNGFPELRARAAEAKAFGYYYPYGHCYRVFKRFLERAKAGSATIHIDDMSRMLAQLLETENIPEIYLKLGSRLFHYFMDEFQDTDPQQWRALKPLLDEAVSVDGSLFFVGDLKQAIYQFREADYRIMLRMVQEIEGRAPRQLVPASVASRCRVRELPRNYRSGGVIVDYNARVFQKRLPALIGAGIYQADVTGLTNYFQESRPDLSGQGYVCCQHRPQPGDEAWLRERLLSIVQDVHCRGYGYGQIAFLAPKNDDLEQAVGWLVEAGVPAASSGALDIRQRKAAAEMRELLKFLDSPLNDLAFANFIQGQILKMSLEASGLKFDHQDFVALAIKARDEGKCLYQTFRETPPGSVIWEQKFKTLYQRVGFLPLYDLLSLACEVFDVWRTLPQEASTFLLMLEAANVISGQGQNMVREFLDLWERPEAQELAMALPPYIDAVRALTVHAAKGLGFPVVINLIHGAPRVDYQVRLRTEQGDKLIYLTKELSQMSPQLKEVYDNALAEDQIQFLNQLYVSCTRARDELYNLILSEKEDDPLLKLFPEEEVGRRLTVSREKTSGAAPLTPASYGGPAYPGLRERWSPSRAGEQRRGLWHHRILEQLEFISDIRTEVARAARMAEDRYGPMDDAEEIIKTLITFLKNPQAAEGFEKRPGRTVLREAEFSDPSGHLYRMDRLVLDDEAVTLWEYKSGQPQDYREQVMKYCEILKQIYPDRRVTAKLGYLDLGRVEELS